ncbi:MAG: hypothetical protein WC503_02435 [Candidatus Shapirobacteria bacterium]
MITLNHPMIKELSLAVIFGLLIGFGLTGTFFFVKQSQKLAPNIPNITVPTPAPDNQNDPKTTPTLNTSTSPNIEITSPQNNDIISTSKTVIKGHTSPNSLVIITTPLKNYNLDTNSQGDFSVNINLEPGLNAINLTVIDQNDAENHTELFITYSTTKLE